MFDLLEDVFDGGILGVALFCIGLICALTLTILTVIFITPDKRRARLNKFFKALHDFFNFKWLILEKILRFFYIFSTFACICCGFFLLFWFSDSYYYGMRWNGSVGFFLLIFGPIFTRVFYEAFMLAIILIKNVISINNHLTHGNDDQLFKNNFSEYLPNQSARPQGNTQSVSNAAQRPVNPTPAQPVNQAPTQPLNQAPVQPDGGVSLNK